MKRKIVKADQSRIKQKTKSTKRQTPSNYAPKERVHDVNNGVIVDPDSFINLFLKISFTAGEVASLRRTCIWWNRLLTSNAIWKIFFQRDFGPSSAKWDELNQKCMKQKPYQDTFWFSEYMLVLNHIPKVVPLPSDLEEQIQVENEKDKEEINISDQGMHLRSTDFTYLQLNLPEEEPDYQIHKLAVILSILAANHYFPKTHSKQVEMMKVGICTQTRRWSRRKSPERVKLVPLLHFCYAVICGEEERIFTLEDYNRIKEQNPIIPSEELKKKKKSKDSKTVQEAFLADDDLIGADDEPIFQVAKPAIPPKKNYSFYEQFSSYWEDEHLTRFQDEPHVGISPNVEGPFKPFVFYLKARGFDNEKGEFRWKTDEVGWAPGFFNASFGWFYHLTMDTVYLKPEQAIVVTKVSAREIIN